MFEFTRINTKEDRDGDIEQGTLYPGISHGENQLRWGFIRKVYGILAGQMVLTTAVSFLTVLYAPINELLRGNSGLLILGQIRPLDCGFCWFVTPDQLWRSQPLTTWPLRNWSSFGHVLMSESCLLFDFQVDVRRAISCVVAVACVSTKASTQLGLPWTLHSVSESDCRCKLCQHRWKDRARSFDFNFSSGFITNCIHFLGIKEGQGL
ncbi:hypothetical protein E3N88_41922 [Mikania micrantha]|uniref:Uncharacterized protein n=1 Tax=Mikania micrantha TaxID=192012 RepID=A0A5N6LJA1_9ASTR|nr:hypothetical protein E3N88_41922 [Mikania micrantha]